MRLPPGGIPLIHGLLKLVAALQDSGKEIACNVYREAVHSMTILRLKSRWDENTLSEQRAASHMLFGRLKLVSDQPTVEFKPDGTIDITTTSSLGAWSEVNLQRLLRQRLGEPLIVAVIHLYMHETLLARRQRIPLLECLCDKFSDLLFSNGKPQSATGCKESVMKWLFGSDPGFDVEVNFAAREEQSTPLLKKVLSDETSLQNTPREMVQNYRIDPTLTELEMDCYHYAVLTLLVNAIQHAVGVENSSTTAAKDIARHVGDAILADLRRSGPLLVDISLILSQWTRTRERSKRIRALQERHVKKMDDCRS